MNRYKVEVVLVTGHFNVIHPGHLRLFRFARECGNRLVVGVESDRIARDAAHVPEQLRLEGVKSNSYVDEVHLVDGPIEDFILRVRPDVIVKGREHENRYNPEADAVARYGGRLLFSSGESVFSSVSLMRREFSEFANSTISMPYDFMARNGITTSGLMGVCKKFRDLNVVVIGDLIVDEYITCQPLGMSQEDPTIVVTPIDSQRFVGGAGIVAAHAAGLGANVHFLSVCGRDDVGSFAIDQLTQAGVNSYVIEDESRPTTLKQRFRGNGKSLLRVSYLHQDAISMVLQDQLFNSLASILPDIDLLVFSDFNYGCLPQPLVDRVIESAINQDVLLAADSQSSSQIGDISRFKHMNLITPTEREARISTRSREDGLVVLAENLRNQADAKNVLLKLGAEGVIVHAQRKPEELATGQIVTEQIPALNSHPKDVAGAGDSMMIAAAMALASGGSVWEASLLGSLAAAIQVGRIGNNPLKLEELSHEISHAQPPDALPKDASRF